MRKRSFNLAWGAWAGILAVMTALGAALAGAQILMMYPRPVRMVTFKYPSMPKADTASADTFDQTATMLYWGESGVVLGRIADVAAPLQEGQLYLHQGKVDQINQLSEAFEKWCRNNLSQPMRYIVVGQSASMTALTLDQIASVSDLFAKINTAIFQTDRLRPAVVPVELVNPL
jgi:hypothetical protein